MHTSCPHRLLTFRITIAAAFATLFCPALCAQTTYRVDGREYHLATDELFKMGGTDAGVVKIEPVKSEADVITTASLLLARARELAKATGIPHELVVYSQAERSSGCRRVLSDRFLVEVTDESALKAVLALPGVASHKALSASPNTYSVSMDSTVSNVIAGMIAAEGIPGVKQVTPEYYAEKTVHLVPSDPFYPEQWHLKNTGSGGFTAGIDINVEPAWDQATGNGVVIVVLDTGLDTGHEDLGRYNPTFGYDWIDVPEDTDPRPGVDPRFGDLDSWHGTAMAGLAASSGNNAFGGAGVAFGATLGAYRLLGLASTTSDFAQAFVRQNSLVAIKNNSWGFVFPEGPWQLGTVSRVELDAIREAVNNGRGGKGTILVFSAGNRGPFSNVNYSGYPALPETIAVNTVTGRGELAPYCSEGACLTVSAPADDVFTTDITGTNGANTAPDGDYTLSNGTSSAAAIVSGVIALMLERNPRLGWRDVQEILMRSATKINPGDVDWQTNGAGINYNHKYGAGLVNAKAACDLALTWPPLGSRSTISETMPRSIFVRDTESVSIPFDFTGRNFRVERAELVTRVAHSYPGDLVITLISPAGTRGVLKKTSALTGADILNDYKFTTTCHWGENASGVWTVRVEDSLGRDEGSVFFKLNLIGTAESGGGGGGGGTGNIPIDFEGGLVYSGGAKYGGGIDYSGGADYLGGTDYSGGAFYSGTATYSGGRQYTRGGPLITPSGASSPSTTPSSDGQIQSSANFTANATHARPLIVASAVHVNEQLSPGQKISRNSLSVKTQTSSRSQYVTTSSNVPWLKVSPTECQVENVEMPLTLEFDATKLKPGVEQGEIEIRWGSRSTDKLNIPVTLKVVEPSLRVVFGKDPVKVHASVDQPKTAGEFKILGFGSGSKLYEVKSGVSWLHMNQASGNISETLPVLHPFNIDATGLPPGVHEGNIICSVVGSEKTEIVPVTLIVQTEKVGDSD